MGENNSSKIRVAPLGEFLLKHHSELNNLLDLLGCGELDFGEFSNEDVLFSSVRRKEKSLNPSADHLEGILHAICTQEDTNAFFINSVKTAMQHGRLKQKNGEKRLEFAAGAISEEDAIQAVRAHNIWAKLETASHPDLFIENGNCILLVEGKLTERGTTREVLYVPHRSQMVRHIENTIEYLREKGEDKQIIAFYILPENFKSDISSLKQKQAIVEDMDSETVPIPDPIREKIAAAYFGCTTWEAVSQKLGIEFSPIKPKLR
jgi:hypothetical protein